jgi:hypothetical protein
MCSFPPEIAYPFSKSFCAEPSQTPLGISATAVFFLGHHPIKTSGAHQRLL